MAQTPTIPSTLVLGLGNTLISDDGIGILVVRELSQLLQHPSVRCEEASLGGLRLLDLIVGYREVFIIDSIKTGQHQPGELMKMEIRPSASELAPQTTGHTVNLFDVLLLGKALSYELPERITIYGIEILDNQTIREQLTPTLQQRLPSVVQHIHTELTYQLDLDAQKS